MNPTNTKDLSATKTRYLIFIRDSFVRDAQIFYGKDEDNMFDEHNNDKWRDANGPLLIRDITSHHERKHVLKETLELYEGLTEDRLNIIEINVTQLRN